MILIGRGLDFTRENEINKIGKQTGSYAVQLSGCAKAIRRVREEEEKDDRANRTFRLRNDVTLGIIWFPGRFLESQYRSPFPVAMTKGFHLFPYRTQKLSPSVPMVLDW